MDPIVVWKPTDEYLDGTKLGPVTILAPDTSLSLEDAEKIAEILGGEVLQLPEEVD